ncbi:MAG: type II secretion system F family protein [Candidatus Omnitrophica bacterium]|nr:type II secretion system F family protein [Candidatus Omnitrophota bacterium]
MHQNWHSDIRPQKIKGAFIQFITIHQKKALFYRQFAVMLKSGISIVACLKQLKTLSGSSDISENLLSSVERGEKLSYAMENSRNFFTNLEIKTISAGEISGNLVELLEKLASYFETIQDVKYRLISGMVYPAILLHAAIIIPAVPLLFTKSILAFLARILPIFIFIYGCAFVIFFSYRALSKPEMEEIRDFIVLKIPIGFGKLFKKVSVIRFLHALNCLYSAGVPITEAIKISAEASGNKIIEKEIVKTGKLVEQGIGFSEAFSANSILPPIVIDMLQTGHQSGTMDRMLEKAASYLQQEVNLAVEAVLKIIPVVVYLLVALYVASIVISFYRGYYYQINSLLE